MRKLFVAGNWKMNLDREKSRSLATNLKDAVGETDDVNVGVSPPYVYIADVADIVADTAISVAGQDMCTEDEGAYTGKISGPMLLDVGCEYVILGHSEPRHIYGETDSTVNTKVHKAFEFGLKPIICVGEKLEQREAGNTEKVVAGQVEAALDGVSREDMKDVTIAYEPVWAIGTGETATPDQAQDVHEMIRSIVGDFYDNEIAEGLVIQYGGSVKPHNAEELLSQPDVDGALVGGASLTADTFVPIIEIAQDIQNG
ncbi:MAG: triose-phosphate isomerase [Planctomycetota bacterium]